ncbi:hypothetical protein FTUN_2283 [Frigoriglobus tundricola]|uniref:Uncharacterized protein n=1 Tax=Frigoriglobus tundricola TaxID=2774151 RepID=A0A6M5YN18_9BACT|nr:hypothetical protein FTUN_2283 [Frigoriglobus tundricola]
MAILRTADTGIRLGVHRLVSQPARVIGLSRSVPAGADAGTGYEVAAKGGPYFLQLSDE